MSTTTSGRPRRADAARNRELLLTAAQDAFTDQGVSASLDEVARAAGVGPGTLYRHFPTRDALVLAVIDEGLTDIHRLGVGLLDSADRVGALRLWLQAYIEQGAMFKGLAATMASPPPAAGEGSTCHLAREAGAALVTRAIEAEVIRPDVSPDDLLDMAAAIAWAGDQPDREPALRVRLLDVFVDGLRRSAP